MAQITEEDKRNVKVIWDKVCVEATGQAILIRLFVDFPKTKNYFKKLKDVSTLEEMQTSPVIKAHGKRVVIAFNQIVENIDNWSEVCNIVARLVKRHQDVHKVEVYNFEILFQVIVNVLADALGSVFTPDIKTSWQNLFSVLYVYIASCYTAAPLVPDASSITV
ncbi:cytoglobin-2-like [Ambystoma mexicanum]|uniref:cytoglobin-2-like n=1 Tax=Ambystoma mexicanum TaxID=8296 RepID=UPI0037E85941